MGGIHSTNIPINDFQASMKYKYFQDSDKYKELQEEGFRILLPSVPARWRTFNYGLPPMFSNKNAKEMIDSSHITESKSIKACIIVTMRRIFIGNLMKESCLAVFEAEWSHEHFKDVIFSYDNRNYFQIFWDIQSFSKMKETGQIKLTLFTKWAESIKYEIRRSKEIHAQRENRVEPETSIT